MSTDKVIVTCALTGVLANRDQCPWVPYTPAEIAEEALRAYEAGAAVVHVHARTDEGGATYEPSVYAAIRREIERRFESVIQVPNLDHARTIFVTHWKIIKQVSDVDVVDVFSGRDFGQRWR